MNKLIVLALGIAFSYALMAQQKSTNTFYWRAKNNKDNSVICPPKIKADDVWLLVLEVNVDPKALEGLDHIDIVVTRDGGEKLALKYMVADLISKVPVDEKTGNMVLYPRIVNYRDEPENGVGTFHSSWYNKDLGGDYFLSKKSTDYSNSKPVDEYTLTGVIYGYKLVGYAKEYDLNKELVTVPKYGSPIAITKMTQINIITSATINPMPKVDSVGDTNELLKIGE